MSVFKGKHKRLSKEEKERITEELIKDVREAVNSDGYVVIVAGISEDEDRAFIRLSNNSYLNESLRIISRVTRSVLTEVMTEGVIFGS